MHSSELINRRSQSVASLAFFAATTGMFFAVSMLRAEGPAILRLAKPGGEEPASGAQSPAKPAVASPAAAQRWGARLPLASGSAAAVPSAAPQVSAPPSPDGEPLSIPLLQGYDSFGLSVPDHDVSGRLRSQFVIGVISRVDDRTVEVRESFLETYREDGSRDLSIEMPKARLDRFTRVLVSQNPVTIRREEFQLRGETMEFNTVTREGGLGGAVEMVIYNAAENGPKGEGRPANSQKP